MIYYQILNNRKSGGSKGLEENTLLFGNLLWNYFPAIIASKAF